MLRLFTLYVLDMLLKHGKTNLSNQAKGFYTDVLCNHFKKLEVELTSFNSFHQPLAEGDLPLIKELEEAGLVQIKNDSVHYLAIWIKYLDKKILGINQPVEVLSEHDDFVALICKNQHLWEMLSMKYSLNRERFDELAALFIKEQMAFGKKYKNRLEIPKHFAYWMQYNAHRIIQKNKKDIKPLGE